MIKRESISSRVLPYVPHPNRLRVKGDDKRLKKAIFEYGTCRMPFSQSFRNKSFDVALLRLHFFLRKSYRKSLCDKQAYDKTREH